MFKKQINLKLENQRKIVFSKSAKYSGFVFGQLPDIVFIVLTQSNYYYIKKLKAILTAKETI